MSTTKTPLEMARHLVFKMQHCGPHEQDRHDAKAWMDARGGRCPCDRCIRDEEKFQSRMKHHAPRKGIAP